MKATFVFAAGVVLAVAATVRAEELVLQPTRDARISAQEEDKDFNGGVSRRMRVGGIEIAAPQLGIVDFDRAAIRAFLEKNKDKKVTAKLSLFIRNVENYDVPALNLEVGALDSAVDWAEGAQEMAKANAGEVCAVAAQFGAKKWQTVDGKEVEQLRDALWQDGKPLTPVNGKGAEVKKDAADVDVAVDLDEAFLKHLATDDKCRGVFLFHRNAKAKLNVSTREKEQHAPTLTLKAE